MISGNQVNIENLVIHKVEQLRPKRLKNSIMINGKEHKSVQDYSVTEYMDTTTGEIISAKQAKELGVQEIDSSLLALQRENILQSLRKEVRDFAVFVLKFRNKRRGITPNVNELCKMYAELHDRRATDVKRLVPTLKKAGILASDDLMMPLFQNSGKNTKATDHLSEVFISQVIFDKMLRDAS